MSRILIPAFLGLALTLCWPATVTCQTQVDSKAWGEVSTTGPPVPVSVAARQAKLAALEEMVRGMRPFPGAGLSSPSGVPPVLGPVFAETSRPLAGPELAAAEARIRAKRAAAARPTPALRWLGPIGPLPPKPRETSTSVPLTGEALARSLAQERAKAAAPAFAQRAGAAKPVSLPNPAGAQSQSTHTAIPGPPLNPEQRAKLEAARAGAATPATPDRH